MLSLLNITILRYKFQIKFIFILYVIIQVNYGISQESKTNGGVYFEEKECVNTSCCDDFRLEFTVIKHLPAGVFHGKQVEIITVNDTDVTMDSNVLERICGLEIFDVRESSQEVIPEFKFVKDSIKTIRIMSSLLRSLTGQNLQNLTLVEEVSFARNYICQIDSDVLKGTVNVKVLDLSQNLLMSIPANLLDPMKFLERFSAYSNNLLYVNYLFNVTHPHIIELYDNNIKDIGSALHISLKSARKMKSHSIMPCEKREYKRYMSKLQSLSTIDVLEMSHNSIKETSHSIFRCYYDPLRKGPGYVLQIEKLNLNGNSLKQFSFLLRYLRIIALSVAMNQIQNLTDEDFKFTTGIANLYLLKNRIKRIDTKSFKTIRNDLEYLDLSSNLITSLNRSMRYLTKLTTLKLGHNYIKSFATDEFSGIEELIELTLEYNQIMTIDVLQQLRPLQYLNIKNNSLESIRLDPVNMTLKWMQLAGNPIKCNCLFHLFIRRLTVSSIATDINTYSTPDFDVNTQAESNSQGLCSYRCTDNEKDPSMFVDCSSKNLSVVPEFLENNFTKVISSVHWLSILKDLFNYSMTRYRNEYDNRFWNFSEINIYSTFYIKDAVLEINLENNSLDSVETTQFPPNLRLLYLANNKLRRLPESIFEDQLNLKVMTLSGNPWKCDCDALKFKKWLIFGNAIIKDIDNVRCGIAGKEVSDLNGRVIWNLTDLDICPTDITLIVSAPSGVLTFVMLCLVVKVLCTKYELNIRLFLYSHDIKLPWSIGEKELDHDKIFDAFVSFSHDDDEFVITKIIPEIEKRNPNIHLCLHYRHFMAGELITANISRAVQTSKRTLVILSRKYLESEWCMLEFRTAHSQAMKDKVQRIIIIKVDELPKKIDPSIKAYLDSTTYVTWGEEKFWNKLLYVIPSHDGARSTVKKNIGDMETLL